MHTLPMNIFYLSRMAARCAQWHCDKHVVKMILETTQLLYTAHWVLMGEPDFRDAPFRKNIYERGYKSIKNKKHPSAIWVRDSVEHYSWLCKLGKYLCDEYRYRFGVTKKHSCEEHILWLSKNIPIGFLSNGWKQPPQAMPDEYKQEDSVAAYKAYYLGPKKRLLKYTKREIPFWILQDGLNRVL